MKSSWLILSIGLGMISSLFFVIPSSFGDYVISPKLQVSHGTLLSDVVCSDGLVAVKKLSMNSVACVRSQTAEILVERGWGTISVYEKHRPVVIRADVSNSSKAYDIHIIKDIQKMVDDCTYSRIQLGYALGSEMVSLIKGNDTCNISISGEVEMGAFAFDCNVPLGNMTKWINWKDKDTPPFPDDVAEYCKKTH